MLMDLFLKTLPAVTFPHSIANPPATAGPVTTTASKSSSSSSSSAAGMHGVPQLATQRLHFHSFLLSVHQQLHQLQNSLPKVVGRSRGGLPVYR
jgi:predicted ATPase